MTPLPSRTNVRYRVLLAACTLAIIAYVHRSGFAAVGPDVKRDLGLSDRQWGFVMSAFLAAYGLFEVPWGLLGDRFGARHVVTVAVLGWSLLTAASATAGALPPGTFAFVGLLCLRFLCGAFQAGAFPSASRMLADWMRLDERGTAQGLLWTSSRAGGAAAPFILGWLTMPYGGWELALIVASLLGILWCAEFWPWFRNRPEEMPSVSSEEAAWIAAGRARRASHSREPWRLIVRSRNAWSLCVMYACAGFPSAFYVTLLPTYLHDTRSLSPGETRWISSLPLACGIVGCFLGGFLSDRLVARLGSRKWGRRIPPIAGFACAGATFMATMGVRDVTALAALLSATFFFFDLTMGPAWAAAADIGERHAGTLGGAMNMFGNLVGGASGTAVAGWLMSHEFTWASGETVLFTCFGASFWLAGLLWFTIDVTKPIEEKTGV